MLNNEKPILLLIVIVLLLQIGLMPVTNADETDYYKILEAKSYKLKNIYQLTNTGSYEASAVKTTILVGAISNSPYQQNINYKVTPWPKYTYVDSSGNIYAEVIVDKIEPKETKTITVEKQVINGGISYSEDIYNMGANYTEFQEGINNKQYFEAGNKVESTASEITDKASDFHLSNTKVKLAKKIYDFVNVYITYDKDIKYANKGALSAIKTARGVCDEYATLFTAICRALKLPARVVSGYWIDEPLKPGVWNDISSKPHAWAEFYLPKVGWIPVEPTMNYIFNGVRTPNSEYFANLKTDEIHLLYGYLQNKFKSDVSIKYTSYKPTNVEIKFGDQVVMPVSSIPNSYAFTDINNNWAKDYINQLYNNGILFAKQPGLYKPADNITRAEFAAYLVNTLELDSQNSDIVFKDVNDNSDYATFIKTAAAYKLITGDTQGYYKPDDPITRQDAATIMERAIEMLNMDYATLIEPEFVDVNQVSSYAKTAVKLIYSMKIMIGKPGNLFEPKSLTTRAEVSKILNNFINATE